MTVWLHFPTIGVEINISNGSLKFVKKIMQYHSFKLDLKCLEILECINEKICIIRICSNYTKCVFLKWAKSIITSYPCCIVCVCITSTQDASHRSRRKSCHYKNEKRKKNYITHPYFVQCNDMYVLYCKWIVNLYLESWFQILALLDPLL